jgi:hypothetical protein
MKTDITKDALRLVAVILLIIIIIMDDFPFYEKMKDATTQLFLGVLVVAFIFYDTVFGFIMGLVVMLIYYEIYKKIISKQEEKQKIIMSVDNGYVITPVGPSSFMGAHDYAVEGSLGPNTHHYDTYQPSIQSMQSTQPSMQSSDCIPLKMDYISEAHLLAAQNNIFDVQNYKVEVKGVEHGLNDEKVYGVQGFDSEKVNFKGYCKSENIYAILSDDKKGR